MTYNIYFVAFCGMFIPVAKHLDKESAKAFVLNRIRRRRAVGFTVERLGNGTWEFTDDNAGLVGDDQGYLRLLPERKVRRVSVHS